MAAQEFNITLSAGLFWQGSLPIDASLMANSMDSTITEISLVSGVFSITTTGAGFSQAVQDHVAAVVFRNTTSVIFVAGEDYASSTSQGDDGGDNAWIPSNYTQLFNWWTGISLGSGSKDITLVISDGINLPPPTDFTASNPATDGHRSISLSWSSVMGAKEYRVQYNEDSEFFGFGGFVTFSTNSGTITRLRAGIEYFFRIRSNDFASGHGDYSTSISETTYFNNLIQVRGVSLEGLDAYRINVSWTAATNAASYTVSYATMSDFSNEATVSVGTNSTILTGLTAETTYYVRVRAVNDEAVNGMGPWSAPVNTATLSAAAGIPGTPTLSSVTDTSITVTWTAGNNATGYKIQYSTESDFSTTEEVTVDGGTTLTTVLTGLTENTTYYVRVISVRTGSMDSAASSSANTTTLISTPAQITGLTMVNRGNTQVLVSWTGVDNATSYEIQWDTVTAFTSSSAQKTNNASYTIQNLTKLTTYYIRVRALRTGAISNGAWSTTLEVATLDDPPAKVTGVAVTSGATEWDRATVTWTAVTDVDGYTIIWASSSLFRSDIIGRFNVPASTLSYVVTGLEVSTTYFYGVSAFKSGAASAPLSDAVSATTGEYPTLVAPSNLSLSSPMYSQINVSWDAVASATSYEVVWDTAFTFSGSSSSAIVNGTSYSITGLSDNTLYYVGVAAQRTNAVSDSARTTGSITTPIRSATVAAGVTATATSTTSIRVNWSASARATGYIVQWRGPNQEYDAARQAAVGSVTVYNITGLTESTVYRIRVIALRTNAPNANPSTEVSTSTLIEAPGAVNNFRSTTQGDDSITLNWSAVSKSTGYILEWGLTSAAVSTNSITISSGSRISHTLAGLTPNTTYYFRIRATRTGAISQGSWTSVLSVSTTALAAADVVTGLRTVSLSNTSITVVWNRSSKATGYRIEWDYSRMFEGANQATITGGGTTSHVISGGLVSDRTLFIRVFALRTGVAASAASNILAVVIPTVERINVDLRVSRFPEDNFSSVPIIHTGDRDKVAISGDSATVNYSDYSDVYIYLPPFNSGYSGLSTSTGTLCTISGNTVTRSTTTVAVGTRLSVTLSANQQTVPLIVALESAGGANYQFKLYQGESGDLIEESTRFTIAAKGTSLSVLANDSVSRVRIDETSGGQVNWYGGAPGFIFRSEATIPIHAKVVRGRDGQRQLVPPKVPGMNCLVWDESGSIYRNRPYKAGTQASLLAMMPGGVYRLMFTGLVDKVSYKYSDSVFTYNLSCLGMSSQLVTNETYGEILSNTTVGKAITTTMEASNWVAGVDYILNESEFSAAMTYWWLDGSSAWVTLNRLITTEGPPSIYYENAEGQLVFIGTGGRRSERSTIPIYTFGSGSSNFPLIGDIHEESEAKDLINHAGIRVNEYEPQDEAAIVWSRSTQFIVSRGEVHEVIASFTGSPLLEYSNINEPDFQSTSETLSVTYKENSRSATRAVIIFDNTSGTQPARVRNVEIQGKHLEVKSTTDIFSDRIQAVYPEVQDSIDTYGIREWGGDPYDALNLPYARHLVEVIPQNFHEGLEVFGLVVYANNKTNLLRMHLFKDEAGARLSGADYTSNIDFDQPFIRKFVHNWSAGLYTVNVVVEARSLDFYGVDPFLIGGNADSGKGYAG